MEFIGLTIKPWILLNVLWRAPFRKINIKELVYNGKLTVKIKER